MVIFYLVCFIISFLFLIWMIGFEKRGSNSQTFMTAIIIVANGGYFILADSKNLEEAIIGVKLTYVGGMFLPLMFFLTVCEVCRVNVRKWMMSLMIVFQIALYAAVCSIGYTSLYYADVQYHANNGVAYITKNYGPLHIFYPITMYGYMCAAFIVAAISLRRRNKVSVVNTLLIVIGGGSSVVAFGAERILGLQFEIMPVIYELLSFFLIIPLHRAYVYAISDNADIIKQKINLSAFISFDRKLGYMSCNDLTFEVFPELRRCHIGERIPAVIPFLGELANQDLKEFAAQQADKSEEQNINIGDKNYSYRFTTLYSYLGRAHGYIVELNDVTEQTKYVNMINNYNRNLESEVRGKTSKIREIQERTLLGMAQMVESRDLSTGGHIKRTSSVVGIFAKKLMESDLGLSEDFLYYVERSAPMHDLGKIAVDDQILRKQGKFTDEEYDKMKAHSAAGAKIVRHILTGIEDENFVNIASNVAHYHHEKVNGKGYPEGISGDDIPIEARIMALADVFDALVSKRCYKEAFTFDRAFSIIEEDCGSHFDSKLGQIFLSCRSELEALYRSYDED